MALGEAGGIGAAQRPEQWAIADRQVFSDARCSTSSLGALVGLWLLGNAGPFGNKFGNKTR